MDMTKEQKWASYKAMQLVAKEGNVSIEESRKMVRIVLKSLQNASATYGPVDLRSFGLEGTVWCESLEKGDEHLG
ncbi:hypothetical protein [Paenibacillus mesotrionivorans]|uniref:Uncharacterized protein n=1 Tax=Paenibacillus mesotrionivorans TaxID=3160968 RepID=A0ACC7P0A8_9BACL